LAKNINKLNMPEEKEKENTAPTMKEKVVLLEVLDPRTEIKTVIHAGKIRLSRYELQEALENFDELEVLSLRKAV